MESKSLKELFQNEIDGKIILPNFQRDFVWEIKQQKMLLATFLVELPISSLLFLAGTPEDFNYRRLCYKDETIEINKDKECFYLLDGQQRMTTLKSIFFDLYNGKLDIFNNEYDKIYGKIQNVWFLKMYELSKENEDIFGYKNLRFNEENLRKYTPMEVFDFIEVKKIYKTKITDWYHPMFRENEKKSIFRDKCIEEGIIPLFGLFEGNLKLQDQILDRIAQKRFENFLDEIDSIKDISEKKNQLKEFFEDSLEDDELENEEEIKRKGNKLMASWTEKVKNFLRQLLNQKVSLIEIKKDEIHRGIAIFETINKGGTPLNNFDLVVAKAAKEKGKMSLTEEIRNYIKEELQLPEFLKNLKSWNPMNLKIINKNDEIVNKFKNQYLNFLTIYNYGKEDINKLKIDHVKRDKLFQMTATDINSLTEKSVLSLIRALAFFNLRLGVIDIVNISYDLMLLPIGSILGIDSLWENEKVWDKVEYWYWTSIFSGRYREKPNYRIIEDIKILYKWIVEENLNDEGVKELLEERYKKIFKDIDYSNEEILFDPQNTPIAIEKNILNYILAKKPLDLCETKIVLDPLKIAEEEIDVEIHHLIPLGSANKIKESTSAMRKNKSHILNSVLNKTYISKESNLKIGAKDLENYMSYLEDDHQRKICLPYNLKKKDSETNEIYYERILKERYEILERDLKNHLEKLKG